jgi:hypothetical protein
LAWDAAHFRHSTKALGRGRNGNQHAPSMWAPHIEVAERDGKLLVQADLPGIKREGHQRAGRAGRDHHPGPAPSGTVGNESGYYRSERSCGSFYRTIPLPGARRTPSPVGVVPRRRARISSMRTAAWARSKFAVGGWSVLKRMTTAATRGRLL